ncbi:hypothetical protein HD554DRAFT_2019311, partial [Boletus coccyginus]
VQLPVVQLLHDIKMHWNSTYFMINHFQVLQQAVDYFLDALCNAEIVNDRLKHLNWEVLQDMKVILGVPCHAQHSMCGENIPLLDGAVPFYETFLAQWKRLCVMNDHPQLAPFVSSSLEWGNCYYDRLTLSKAYLFSMCEFHPMT